MRVFITTVFFILYAVSYGAMAESDKVNEELSGKVAVITGSSSGLGFELVQLAVANKMRLVLVDVRPQESDKFAESYRRDGGQAMVIAVDLSDPEQRSQIIKKTIDEYGQIDYLFNNAGYAYLTTLADHNMEEAKKLFEVNYWAYVDLAQRALPYMLSQKSGYIINTSSVLGVVPSGPQMGPYAATKHALIGFFQAADAELNGSGIHVKLVCPGGMKTNIIPRAVGKYVAQVQHIDDEWEPPSIVAKEIFDNLHDDTLLQFPSVAKGMRKQYIDSL